MTRVRDPADERASAEVVVPAGCLADSGCKTQDFGTLADLDMGTTSTSIGASMNWSVTFVDLEGDGPRSFADVQALEDETSPHTPPTANIQRLSGRLQMRFPEPVAWGFTARGRLLAASFAYGLINTDLLLEEADAAHAALFDEDHATIFPPMSIGWPWIDADWVVEMLPESDPPPRPTAVQPGDRVSHDMFGEGTVVSTSGSGQLAHAKIAFDTAGSKSLALRYAPLRLL